MAAPEFGAWLATQRGERSYEWAASRVRKLVEGSGLKVNRSAIEKYEKGRIPPWPVLHAFASMYTVSPAEIAARLFQSVQYADGRDLLRPTADHRSGSHQEVPDVVPAASAVGSLESLRERNRIIEREVQDVIGRLTGIASRLIEEAGETPLAAAGRPRRHRKTG